MIEHAHENVAQVRCSPQDRWDSAHDEAVAEHAEQIALGMGFTRSKAARLREAGAVHDIGKTMISDEILNKPGPLDAREWRKVRLHPVLGQQILLKQGRFDIAPWVRCHHERYDGLGYPDRLVGRTIPFEARILAVADAYDAMVSTRPYKPAMHPAHARAELRAGAGGQFDPGVVAAFLRVLRTEAPADSHRDVSMPSSAVA